MKKNCRRLLAFRMLALSDRLLPSHGVPRALYHQVADTPLGYRIGGHVTPQAFRQQMYRLAQRGYRGISVREYLALQRDQRLSLPKVVGITFDDGQKDVYTNAFPVLRELGFSATIFVVTNYVRFWSKYQRRLKERFLLALPPAPVIDLIVDKRQTYEAARQIGVPVPAFGFAGDESSLSALAREIPYPALIEPVMSHTGTRAFAGKALRIESPGELVARYRQLTPASGQAAPGQAWSSILVQEMIQGSDNALWTLGAYLDANVRPLAIFCGRKVRQNPPHFGTCSLGECAWDLQVVRLGLRLLKGIGYVGPTQVEFKRDPRDGQLKLIGINARTWLWHTLATDGQVDLAYVAYLDLIGQNLGPGSRSTRHVLGKPGTRWLSLIADVSSARRYIRQGELSWPAWLRSWHGVRKMDMLSLRDPVPFATTLWRVVKRKARAME